MTRLSIQKILVLFSRRATGSSLTDRIPSHSVAVNQPRRAYLSVALLARLDPRWKLPCARSTFHPRASHFGTRVRGRWPTRTTTTSGSLWSVCSPSTGWRCRTTWSPLAADKVRRLGATLSWPSAFSGSRLPRSCDCTRSTDPIRRPCNLWVHLESRMQLFRSKGFSAGPRLISLRAREFPE